MQSEPVVVVAHLVKVLLVISILLGCASTSRIRYEKTDSVEMERKVIEIHPTQFRTSFEEGGRVWERALLAKDRFFKGEAHIESIKNPIPETKIVISSENGQYSIVQRLENDGFFFAVIGDRINSSKISDRDINLNERNLARFLKAGVFQDILFIH